MKISSEEGFSLIEVIVILVIIAILGYLITFKAFIPYKNKAYAASDSIVIAKNCLTSLMEYCLTHPGEEVNPSTIKACSSREGLYGRLTIKVNKFYCSPFGELPNNLKVEVYNQAASEFKTVCTYTTAGINCKVEREKD